MTALEALSFPADFVWGAATASYQIEGAVGEDGRGRSIWDTFSHTPGKVAGGDTGDIACDHYHRYREDVALMSELGLGAYRFSVAWPRVQPTGSGPVNPKGLAFYDRLVDRLLAAGISPYVTLYHWDLPQELEDRGGWTERDTALRFAEYAQAVHARLGDRVAAWITINEPWVAAFLGYGAGVHAPGRTDPAAAFAAAHHLLLAHGLAARALPEGVRRALTLNLSPVIGDPGPASVVDALLNRQFLDAALRGRYPREVLEIAGRHGGLGHIRDGDLEQINAPLDLLGINYYHPTAVAAGPGRPANPAFPGTEDIAFPPPEAPVTAMGWPVRPDALTDLLLRITRDYPGVPLLITENGAAFDDVTSNGSVPDAERVRYLRDHVRAAHAAMQAGADLRGYLAWSLMDNFEWAEGYARRFGLVHVDYATQRRTLKDSGRWFRDLISHERSG